MTGRGQSCRKGPSTSTALCEGRDGQATIVPSPVAGDVPRPTEVARLMRLAGTENGSSTFPSTRQVARRRSGTTTSSTGRPVAGGCPGRTGGSGLATDLKVSSTRTATAERPTATDNTNEKNFKSSGG